MSEVTVPSPGQTALAAAGSHAALEHLYAAQEDLLRAIAHDLRAPLRHLASFAPLLQETADGVAAHAAVAQAAQEDPALADALAEVREFSAMMEQSARRMMRMLDGMAQLSRAGRAVLQPACVDWYALCRDVAQPLQARDTGPQVRGAMFGMVSEAGVPPSRRPVLRADAHWLRIAVQAVLDNAAKFSARQAAPVIELNAVWLGDGPAGHAPAGLQLATVSSAGQEPCWQPERGAVAGDAAGYWRLTIRDNGAGFDTSQARQLGGLFQRMHREAEFEGVGCGLALVRLIAQRHGAGLWVAASPGAGCCVTLDWPAAAVDGPQ